MGPAKDAYGILETKFVDLRIGENDQKSWESPVFCIYVKNQLFDGVRSPCKNVTGTPKGALNCRMGPAKDANGILETKFVDLRIGAKR